MTTGNRDHKAAYRRRIERGLAKGLTKQQARGHGPKPLPKKKRGRLSEIPIEHPLHQAFEAFRKGAPMTPTARRFHLSPETFRHFVEANADIERKSGRIRLVWDNRRFLMPLFSKGRKRDVTVYSDQRDQIASYLGKVGAFLNSNDPKLLDDFRGRRVRDVYGKSHPFETDPNRLHEISAAGEFEYAILYKGFAVL